MCYSLQLSDKYIILDYALECGAGLCLYIAVLFNEGG